MQFRAEQFDGLIHNPFDEDPDETLTVASYGRLGMALNGIEKYTPQKKAGKVCQYILYLYDKNTPLRNLYPDVDQRKNQAATLSGFDLDKDAKFILGLFELKDAKMREVVINFIRFQNSQKWSALVANEQLLWEIQANLIRQFTDFNNDKQLLDSVKVKTQISETSDKIMDLIEKYQQDLFAGDQVAKDAASQIRSSGITPETFALTADVH